MNAHHLTGVDRVPSIASLWVTCERRGFFFRDRAVLVEPVRSEEMSPRSAEDEVLVRTAELLYPYIFKVQVTAVASPGNQIFSGHFGAGGNQRSGECG